MKKFATFGGSAILLCGSTVFDNAPAKAISFNFSTAPFSSSTSAIVYKVSGVTLTANNPAGTNSPVMNRNSNGICAYQTFSNQLNTGSPFCGQNINFGTVNPSTTLTSFQISFDKDMVLKSFTTAAAGFQDPTTGQVETGTIQFKPQFTTSTDSFTSPTLTITSTRINNTTFSNANVSGCNNPVGQATCNVSFTGGFKVSAGQLITVSTNDFDTTLLSNPNGQWRLFALEADEAPVPGPLPLLGAGAAFGWSRRLRYRIKAGAA